MSGHFDQLVDGGDPQKQEFVDVVDQTVAEVVVELFDNEIELGPVGVFQYEERLEDLFQVLNRLDELVSF